MKLTSRLAFLVFGCTLLLLFTPPLCADDDDALEDLEERIEILRDEVRVFVERDRHDVAELLELRVVELRKKLAVMEKARAKKREKTAEQPAEIKAAKKQLKVMRTAFTAFREAENEDAMERMEHAIHALELAIKGRRDEEAREIQRTAPKVGEKAELLEEASRLWAEYGHEKKSDLTGALADQFRKKAERAAASRTEHETKDDERPRLHLERAQAERLLDGMKMAFGAIRESQRKELAEPLGRSIRSLEVQLAGRQDEEARRVVEAAPKREHVIELLFLASNLYKEWGRPEQAAALQKTGQELLELHREAMRRHEREVHAQGEERAHAGAEAKETRDRQAILRHMEHMQEQLHRLHIMAANLQEQLQALRAQVSAR